MLISVLGSSTVSVLSINDRIHYIYIVFAFRYLILPTMMTPGSATFVFFVWVGWKERVHESHVCFFRLGGVEREGP